jgi:predicted Rossmann fold flavoprotein
MEIFDVVVIGGGPAGIIAAGTAAKRGAKVLLLEKNQKLGKKILITGHSRCNLTQAEFDIHKLVRAYGSQGAFLFSALHQFGPSQIMDFFAELGVELKIEDNQRVFPQSDDANEIVQALEKYLKDNQVIVKYSTSVKKILAENDKIVGVELIGGENIVGKNFVIATGGLSYPVTGATGDGLVWAKTLGHRVVEPTPALVPLLIKESFAKEMQGVSFSQVELVIWQANKKIIKTVGDILFTHFGLSGPAILNVSKLVNQARKNGLVSIQINFLPQLDEKQLDDLLNNTFRKLGKKACKNVLSEIVLEKLAELFLEMAQIDPNKQAGNLTKVERIKLRTLLHSLTLTVAGSFGFDLAMVTSGGVDLSQIDPKTMCSKLFNNLYVVGEILDIDGPTGGYNLTVAWSTGHQAGQAVKIAD